jgi:hypothetical protein
MTEPQQPDMSNPEPPAWVTDWQQFWRHLLIDKDTGLLDQAGLMRLLHDYRTLMYEVSLVYDEITGGLLSKPDTRATEVLRAADDRVTRYLARQLRVFVQEMIDSGRRPQIETLHELLVFAAAIDANPAEDARLGNEMRRALRQHDARRAHADQTGSGSPGRSNKAG